MSEASLRTDFDHAGNIPSKTELLEQVERIAASGHFRNSKRYPAFLRFVVERTLADDTEVLKERNLGVEVFGRLSDYDTSADPIVRVTAGEVRKRIAQYYQSAGHENEPRIDLPLGSYIPHFYPAGHRRSEVTVLEVEPETQVTVPLQTSIEIVPVIQSKKAGDLKAPKRRRLLIGITAAALAIIAGLWTFADVRSRFQAPGTRFFWKAFTSTSRPALIVIGVHYLDGPTRGLPAESRPARTDQESALWMMESMDMVPVSDIVSYSKCTDLLTQRSLAYRTKGSSETSLEDLRTGPVLLIGGFNNVWTLRLTSGLRFRFVAKSPTVNSIQDIEHPESAWTFNNLQPAVAHSIDYAVVASYYDPTIEQHVLVAAGIGKSGTMAATEFVTTERYMRQWLADSKTPENRNVELVLATEVLDGESGPPHVVAYTSW